MGVLTNLAGAQFGFLTVTSRATMPLDVSHRLSFWNVACRCGRRLVIRSDALRNNSKRSCGECKTEYNWRVVVNTIYDGKVSQ